MTVRGSEAERPRSDLAPTALAGTAFVVAAWLTAAAALGAPGSDQEGPRPFGEERAPVPELAQYEEAAREEGRPLDWYNYGTALLRSGRAEEAVAAFRRGTESARPMVRRFGLYNAGVAEARAGREAPAPPVRRSRLVAARDAFRDALRAEPEDEDARWNLEVVERWLEEARSGGGSSGGGAAGEEGGAGAEERARREAEALLDAAGRAESGVREQLLERNRYRDPVVERNW